MEKKLNCWEFHECGAEVRRRCSAALRRLGRYCWVVSGSMSVGATPQCVHIGKYGDCRECDYYRYLHDGRYAHDAPERFRWE